MNRRRPLLASALLVPALLAGTACSARSLEAPGQGVVLLRTFYIVLRPGAKMGPARPPLDKFIHSGAIPGGQSGPHQLNALWRRFTLPDLKFQYSSSRPIEIGGGADLEMGFGQTIRIQVSDLKKAGETYAADFVFRFGEREAFHRRLNFVPGNALIFAGHLDASLPILSVMSLEIRLFPRDKQAERKDFLAQADRDKSDFAPPPPVQRDREPYIPGIGDVTMPELISSTAAVYPEAAKPEKLEGQVIVEVVVDQEGNVTNPRILTSSSPIFEPPAFEAAKTYRYKPATRNGVPVSVTMNLIMIFKYSAFPSP